MTEPQQVTGESATHHWRWLPVAGVLVASIISRLVSGQENGIYEVHAGTDVVLALDRPQSTGSQLVFHRYPDGVLTRVKKSVLTSVIGPPGLAHGSYREPASSAGRQVVTVTLRTTESVTVTAKRPGLEPGEVKDLGSTGLSDRTPASLLLKSRSPRYVPRLGEGLPGKALLNPERDYRPEWDGRQVPGLNIPFPNSRNDWREGRTLAYPPGNGFQRTVGDAPTVLHDGLSAPLIRRDLDGMAPPHWQGPDSIPPPLLQTHDGSPSMVQQLTDGEPPRAQYVGLPPPATPNLFVPQPKPDI
jgi:hypothetical protein